MDGLLKGKVALITGGGTGLGAATARLFVEEGAKAVITGRRKEPLEKVADELPEGSVMAFQGDVSDFKQAQAMVDAAVKFGGKLDILVNCAGTGHPGGKIVDLPVEHWQMLLGVNLTGPFLMMKAAIPEMIKNGGGSIVNVSSLAGVRCIPAMPAYTATKAGLIGLTQAAALDYGGQNIRVNAVCPGLIRSETMERGLAGLATRLETDITGAMDWMTKFTPLRRPASPEEIARAVLFLAGDDSAFMTGEALMIDGGACVVDPCGSAIASIGMNWGRSK
ncbi:MAG: SDR family oxidoreductase [Oscillospiraceae bacterium]|jgi:NAD(P)-dependent dehydrogenase (short-subunit alcohol dehydrogenase family)|nr:SDR family oxidoreductase [Oscillospiraceae bacterium]